jgi:prepilin-type N-terminal cleavage/methylation domain-containing protein
MIVWRKLMKINKEAGFTLIELMLSLAITGIIGLGASMATGQVLSQTSKNNDYTTVNRNAMNALFWISRDAQMAQSFSGETSFPDSDLTLQWIEWDHTVNTAVYSLDDGMLTRQYTKGSEVSETVIAQYISPDTDLTNCVSYNGTLTVTITANIGEGSKNINVTRVRDIVSRPKL